MNAPRSALVAPVAAGLLALAALGLWSVLREEADWTGAGARSFAAGRSLFIEALVGGDAWQDELGAFALELRAAAPSGRARLLAEPEGQCLGQGAYLLRDGRDAGVAPLAITAPHRQADRHTGDLAALLFEDTKARAAAWNSAPRVADGACPRGVDVAHAPHHLFSAFHAAFAAVHPQGRIVQLHGFDPARRRELEASEAGAILSDGSRAPSPALLDLADCLSTVFAPARVLVFPFETGELGALGNAQAALLRSQGFAGFAHLELAPGLRARLLAEPALREALGRCLGGGVP